MRNLRFVGLFFICLFCACSDDELASLDTRIELDQSSEFYILPCNNFVQFDPVSDSFLKLLISSGVDIDGDGKISCTEAEKVTEIDLNNASGTVSTLKGIESFVNLEKVYGKVNITSEFVNLYNNINLREIDFTGSFDGKTRIGRLVLPQGQKLEVLRIFENVANKLENIESQTRLRNIFLSYADLSNELDLSNSSFLQEVRISGGNLSSVVLSEHPYLKKLYLDQIGNITSLNTSGIPNLEELSLTNNLIKTIDLSKNLKLSILGLDKTKITQPNVTKLTELKRLFFSYNEQITVSGLELTNNKKLEYFYLQGGKISTLDISQNTKLEQFYLYKNLVEEIDFTKNPELIVLVVAENKLKSADLSQNGKLETLNLYNNVLSELDLGYNSALTFIVINDNRLTILNLRNGNNENFNYMDARNNLLACIQIDDLPNPYRQNWDKDDSARYSTNCEY